ncbi:MAG: phosphotransferase [Salinibacterium sp.]|nr:phosphotransferase [Salinibacterium sp.]
MTPQRAPLDFLAPWMARQRWFANKGSLPLLEEIGCWSYETDEPDVEVVTHLLLDHTVGKPALYQVPLTYRSSARSLPAGLVGEFEGRFIYDGPHDPAFTAGLLAFIAHGSETTGDRTWAIGRHTAGTVADGLVSRVLTGEQSNTSIIFEAPGATPLIIKLFRAIHDGENPDVVLQTALALAGSTAVPASVGHVVAEWSDRGEASGLAKGHLAFAQEFLPGVEDAWRVALAAAEAGIDFSREARELGIATAGVHATLAASMPSSDATTEEIDAILDQMHGRLAAAIREVPALSANGPALREIFAQAGVATWPAQQRIHGDLHLGQVLKVPDRGWVLVDFEGEPLRPMRERNRLDSPLRDVAGMLRSFDYVSGSLAVAGQPGGAEWAASARSAFSDGYSEASGLDLRDNRAVVDAFEVDKALYETVYEARNRPTWLEIPVAALRRLSARVAT